jgi:hypothetical protein
LKSVLDCLPCAIEQGLRAGRAGPAEISKLPDIVSAVLQSAKSFDLDDSPAGNATRAVKAVCSAIGNDDPYKNIKREQNLLALRVYPRILEAVRESGDVMEAALLASCFGNVIDLGAQDSFDLEKEMKSLLMSRFARSDIAGFKDRLKAAKSMLLLADNSGEIVFDRILLEQLPPELRKTVAVKSGPIINDATVEDAIQVDMGRVSRIMATGCATLGIDWGSCSREFLSEFNAADIVIAKGHANFETLNEIGRGIFFLLKAKCDVVARELAVPKGSLVMVKC